jgi:hypothetical protein
MASRRLDIFFFSLIMLGNFDLASIERIFWQINDE